MLQTFSVALLIGLLACFTPVLAAPESSQAIAYRVSSTFRPIRFPLPTDSGAVALSPDTAVVVSGKRPSGPWRVNVERGEAAVTIPQGSKAAGTWLSGTSSVIQIAHGTSVFWRDVDNEGGALQSGQALLGRLAVSKNVSPSALPPPTAMLGGQRFEVVDPVAVKWSDTTSAPAWMAPLGVAAEKATGDGLVRLPISVPPSAKREQVDPNVRLRPLTMGSASFALPNDAPLKNTEKLTKYRDRLLLSLPGRGLSGPALYVDLTSAEPGRIHNTLMSGGRGFVRFHLLPDWVVTMAPGSLVELDGSESVVLGESGAPRMKLHRGALLAEPEQIGKAPKGAPISPAIDGLTVSGDAGAVVGSRAVVFAAQTDPKVGGGDLLALARETFAGLRAAQGPQGYGVITLLGQLPAAPKALTHYIPLQASLPGKDLDITLMGAPPADREDVTVKALQVDLVDPIAGPMPVALVIPATLSADPGADPEDLQVLMVPPGGNASTHLREVFDRWRELAGMRQPEVPKQKTDGKQPPYAGIVIGAVILVLVMGGGRKLEKLFYRLFGMVRTRCPRCDLILDQIPVSEVGAREDQDPVFALLDFDNLTDVNRQSKSRNTVFEWFRGRAKKVADAYRFRVRADWCQRCMQGAFTSEVVNGGWVMDESTTEYSGSDTHELLVSLRKPPAPPKPAAPEGEKVDKKPEGKE